MKKRIIAALVSLALLGGSALVLSHKEAVETKAAGSYYTRVTSLSELSVGDEVVIASATSQVANGSEVDSKYLSKVSVSITGNTLYDSTSSAVRLRVENGSSSGTYSFKNTNNNKYLASNKNSDQYLRYFNTTKADYSSYNLTMAGDNSYISMQVVATNSNNYRYIKYNPASATQQFRTYKSNSGGMEEINLYKYTGAEKKISIDQKTSDDNVEVEVGNTVNLTTTAENFTPVSYSWSVNSGNESKVQITPDNDKVSVKFLSEGTDIQITVTATDSSSNEYTASIKYDAVVYSYTYQFNDGNYFINVKNEDEFIFVNNSFAEKNNDITSNYLIDDNGKVIFEHAAKGNNTYYLKNSSGKYLVAGSNARLNISNSQPDTYWTITENSTPGTYKISDHDTSKVLVYSPRQSNYGKFMCFLESGVQTYDGDIMWLNISKPWTFSSFEHTDIIPDKLTYKIEESFDPTGMILKANFTDEDSNVYPIDVTNEYSWPAFSENQTSITGTFSIGTNNDSVTVTGLKVLSYELHSISVNYAGAKVSYIEGQTIKKDDLIVTATYKADGGDDEIVTLNASDYTVYPTKAGRNTTEITVGYEGKTSTYPISVTPNHFIHCDDDSKVRPGHNVIFTEEVYGVEMKADFTAQDYEEIPTAVGQFEVEQGAKPLTVSFKNSGGKYLGIDGTKVALLDSKVELSSWTVIFAHDECYIENVGKTNYYLCYSYSGKKFQVYENGSGGNGFAVIWIDENSTPEEFIDHLELDTSSVKKTFAVNEAFSYDGLIVKAVYESGSKVTLDDYVVVAPNMSSAGSKTVTVRYINIFEATYQITVSNGDTPSGGGDSSGGGSSGGGSSTSGDSDEGEKAKGKLNFGAVIGISVGSSVLILGGVGLAVFLIVTKKKKQ
ncbi:MAG: bacterial Ig-like domain-containing protein [Bacilli bacterium]|nr:bacterial Ig-like domain-containing protein [Bacilli bacterium]